MVMSSPIIREAAKATVKQIFNYWNVTPETIEVGGSVRCMVNMGYYDPVAGGYRRCVGSPIVFHVTKPDGSTFDTSTIYTDAEGHAYVFLIVDQSGTWTFIAEAGTYEDDNYLYLGCQGTDSMTVTEEPGPPPFELDLPTAAGIALAIADLVLVGYYAVTQMPVKR